MRWLDRITNSTDRNLNKLQEIIKDRVVWCIVVHGTAKVRHHLATEQQRICINKHIGYYLYFIIIYLCNYIDRFIYTDMKLEKPGMLQLMRSQRSGHDLVTEKQHTDMKKSLTCVVGKKQVVK